MNYLTVPGAALTVNEREWLKDIAALTAHRVKHPLIFNLGVMWGASMWCLRTGAPKADLVGLDIDLRRTRTNPKDHIWQEDELNARFYEEDSRTYGLTWTEPIHLLFIDGDHHYDVVTLDIAGWTPHVVPGGIVAFHDYSPKKVDLDLFPELCGLHRAIDEWHAETQWRKFIAVDSIVAFERSADNV